jgi:hypothetical protein
VDPDEESIVYLEAAAKCRKAALSSANPQQRIVMAEQWEWLAKTSDGTYLLARACAKFETELESSDSAPN